MNNRLVSLAAATLLALLLASIGREDEGTSPDSMSGNGLRNTLAQRVLDYWFGGNAHETLAFPDGV